MAKLSIHHPNVLSEKDFENLRGTSLMETLVRNRMQITFSDDADDDAAISSSIIDVQTMQELANYEQG